MNGMQRTRNNAPYLKLTKQIKLVHADWEAFGGPTDIHTYCAICRNVNESNSSVAYFQDVGMDAFNAAEMARKFITKCNM
jgi:hypothetical protein